MKRTVRAKGGFNTDVIMTDLLVPDVEGDTPLHLAVFAGNEAAVREDDGFELLLARVCEHNGQIKTADHVDSDACLLHLVAHHRSDAKGTTDSRGIGSNRDAEGPYQAR